MLPNGDVRVAEPLLKQPPPAGLFDRAMQVAMARAGASGDRPNRITLLRDADGIVSAVNSWTRFHPMHAAGD